MGDELRAWKQTAASRIYYLYDGTLPVMEVGIGNANSIRPLNTFGAQEANLVEPRNKLVLLSTSTIK